MPTWPFIPLTSIAAISSGTAYLTICPRNNSTWNILGRKIALGIMISGAVGWFTFWTFKKTPTKRIRKKSVPKLVRFRKPSTVTSGGPSNSSSSTTNVSLSSSSSNQSLGSEASTQNITTVSNVEHSPPKVVEKINVETPKQAEKPKNDFSPAAAATPLPGIGISETLNPILPPNVSIPSSSSNQSLVSEASTQNPTTVSKAESDKNEIVPKSLEQKLIQSVKQSEEPKNYLFAVAPPATAAADSSSLATGTTEIQPPSSANVLIPSSSNQSLVSEASTQNTVSKVDTTEQPTNILEKTNVETPKQSEELKNDSSAAAVPPLPIIGTIETQNPPSNVLIPSSSIQSLVSEASTQNSTTVSEVDKTEPPPKVLEKELIQSQKQPEEPKNDLSAVAPPVAAAADPLSLATGTLETINLPPNVLIPSSSSNQSLVSEASTQNPTTVSKVESDNETPPKSSEKKPTPSPKHLEEPKNEVCDCGVESMDDKEKYSEETTLPNSRHPINFPNKTLILPMSYESYRPVNLTYPPEGQSQISPAAMQKPDKKEETTLLTPFRPILHSMYYANRHALLIEDLIQNYQFLED